MSREKGGAPLQQLMVAAANAGHEIEVCDSAELAAAEAMTAERIDCVILAAPDRSREGSQRHLQVARDIERLAATLPRMAVVVVGAAPEGSMVSTSFRAGAYDFVDTAEAPPEVLVAALDRAASETERRTRRAESLGELRSTVEEFLRILVRTERRTIDLEEQLRAAANEIPDTVDSDKLDAARAPRVLVVDDDEEITVYLSRELGEAGLDIESASSGQAALDLVRDLTVAGKTVDLALVDKNLPDGSGLDVIKALRNGGSGPPAMLMTGFASAESAIDAADLGVAGYVLKPFGDIDSLIERVRDVATARLNQQRERGYLLRIKKRHAEFLTRYRALAAQLDKLV